MEIQQSAAHRPQPTMFPVLIPDLSVRCTLPELMDDPCSDSSHLVRTLDQFPAINRLFSRYGHLAHRCMFPSMLRQQNAVQTVADIGAGSGDYALWLHTMAQRAGVRVQITCVDTDPRVVAYLNRLMSGRAGITVLHASLNDLACEGRVFDYVSCNHMLHHIDALHIPSALQDIVAISRSGFLINDLRRSLLSYWGFYLFGSVFLRNSFALYDGSLSIRKGFILSELREHTKALMSDWSITCGALHPGRVFIWGEK